MKRFSSREFNQDVSRAKRVALHEPVFVTDRGKPTHVLLSIEAYRHLMGKPDTLADLVGSRGVAVFLRADVGLPPAGWTELLREDATQYVAGRLPQPPPTDGEVVELGPGDVPEMVGLAEQTQPGPFGPQSHLTGRHAGVRRDGRLVAMAGERMRVDGWGEISTVCVHPSVRGQGLGAVVTLAAARWIEARGDRPMLHVRAGNDGAHRLYRRIGFEVRRLVTVGVFRRDG